MVQDWTWILNAVTATQGVFNNGGGAMPGGDPNSFILHFGQLYALGGAMIVWAFLLRSPSWVIGGISLASVVITQLVVPGLSQHDVLFPPLVRLLVIAGRTGIWNVPNPLIPWLGAAGLGLLFGRLLQWDPRRAGRVAGWTGLVFLVLFVIIRINGGFGNFNPVPPGWMGFLTVTKYPPDLAFLSMTLGITLVIMAGWRWAEPYLHSPYNPLIVFGRSALFSYLVHLWLYCLIGILFFRAGTGLVGLYSIWLLGLVILYPLCYWYGKFKRRTPVTSIWRFF